MSESESGRARVELPVPDARAAEIRTEIDEECRRRAAEAPPLALRRTASLEAQRQALHAAMGRLRRSMDVFGEVRALRRGWLGRIELAAKTALRKLVQRHIDQQREVHAALQDALERFDDLLAAEHDLLDENAARLAADSVRRRGRSDAGA